VSRIDLIGTKHPLYQGLKSVFGQAASVEERDWRFASGGSISKMLTYTECVESAKNVAVFVLFLVFAVALTRKPASSPSLAFSASITCPSTPTQPEE